METEYQISIIWGYEESKAEIWGYEPDCFPAQVYSFNTQAELNAFRKGIAHAIDWARYRIVGED